MDSTPPVNNAQTFQRSSYRGYRYYERHEQRKPTPKPSPPVDPCAHDRRAFNKCVNANSDSLGTCQYYYEMVDECKQKSASHTTAPPKPDVCADNFKTFSNCVSANDSNLAVCQFYFDTLQECRQRSAFPPVSIPNI